MDADSTVPNQLYFSGFVSHDAFITLYEPGEISILVPNMERDRAARESRADQIDTNECHGGEGRIQNYGAPKERHVLGSFLDARGVNSVVVPTRFPVATAEGLREQGVGVIAENDDIGQRIRSVKSAEEIEHIERTQDANESAMTAAANALRAAEVRGDELYYEGDVLTSERLKSIIRIELISHECDAEDTIVSCGPDAADPHTVGSGPLKPDETIIVDIFPRDQRSRYYADMTRTFVRGTPSAEAKEFHDLTLRALDAALDRIEPGVEAGAVHDAACQVYEDAGHPTLRTDPNTNRGFVHRTGHGIGLAIHEDPRLSHKGGTLRPGNVVTVEPGLYDPEVGGVRVEDIVVVREDGYENLTTLPTGLDP